ncbi:MAG: aminotransferase class I/II-fold pyridoxal phosphate-dependent enzyme [Nitrososphaeria archaeon]
MTKYSNLLILRTMSKSFGIAGLRVGYLLGNANLVLNLKIACHFRKSSKHCFV